ncbi:MAG TPA: hypothetical protein VFZ23_13665 [Pyrinomonadaceae bacterium]
MKTVGIIYIVVLIFAATMFAQNPNSPESRDTSRDNVIGSEFEARIRQYTAQREALEDTLPALPKKATAEQIAAHKAALLKKVLADRKGAVRGEIFTPEAESMIRAIIAGYYTGRDAVELRKEVAEAENKTVPIKVNAIYPEAAELLEMPPPLLMALPDLPKQVRYRFVGTNLLIVDRENHLIVDYMTNALP